MRRGVMTPEGIDGGPVLTRDGTPMRGAFALLVQNASGAWIVFERNPSESYLRHVAFSMGLHMVKGQAWKIVESPWAAPA